MAFANNINRDMTAADARAAAGQSSWEDIYPDDFDFDGDPWEFLGDHRLYFDTAGEPHFVAGKNPFSGEVSQKLVLGEKDGLLSRKAAGGLEGAIRDTRGRYGEPKEWDHVVVGLTRAEAEALGTDGVKAWAQTVIQAMQDSPAGDGKRQMLVTPIHTDTDNLHVQFLLHRIPVNEQNKTVGASYELSRNSEAAGQMKQLNTALEAAGLPMISDFRMGAFSVSEPRAVSTDELAKAAERVVEAGGVVPPDLTTGPLPIQRERVTPEMRHLDSMLADAVKRQKEAEAFATSAATAVAAAQHARAALEQYEAEVKARTAVEAELARTTAAYEETTIELSKRGKELEGARGEIETLTEQVTTATAKIAEQVDQIESLEGDKTELKAELDELRGQLAQTDAALEQERAGRKADAAAAAKREAEQSAAFDQLGKDLAALQASHEQQRGEIDRITDALKQAQQATEKAVGELEHERATFVERARAWAEEHVAGPLRAQVDILKAELVEGRNAFMEQLRELTASIRPQQAEQAAQARQRQQWPSWAKKSFSELSSTERTAMQKALTSEIEKGRQQEGLRLSDFHRIVNDQWNKQQAAASDQDTGMKPKKP